MELLVKRVLVLFLFLTFTIVTTADNKIFKVVSRIKKINSNVCGIASYRAFQGYYRITCIGRNLNKFLYNVPVTVDIQSSFYIDSNHYMDINNGMDSVYLFGKYLGRAVKEKIQQNTNEVDNPIFPIPNHPNGTIQILDNETTPTLGTFYRVVIDHIKMSGQENGMFSTRIINCKNDTYVNLSKGRSIEEMEKNYQPPGNLLPITLKSPIGKLRNHVCGEKNTILPNEESILD
jgi:hypothetical protein